VVGRRRPRGRGAYPWTLRLANAALARQLRRRAGLMIFDCGPVRAARRTTLLMLDVQDRRSGYPVETLVKAAAAGLRVRQGRRTLYATTRTIESDRYATGGATGGPGLICRPRSSEAGRAMIKRAEMIVVLAKEPRLGRVKTRLQSRFSAEEAAQLAAASVRDTQRAVRASRAPRRVLCWDGDSSDFADGFEVLPQRSGTLNDRLAGAFDDLGRDGPARMLLIGMDTPEVSSALLDTDWDDCDAILGLSEDGGFWAIGLRTSDAVAGVFAGIEMSTGRTGSAQLARLLSLDRSVKLLPPLRDIDEPADAACVADRFPSLEFSRCYAALTGARRPELIFDQLYAGSPVRCDAEGEVVLPLEAARWSGQADEVD
jgi:glycosyltransferase A (GT-A) superfamily protein (DUF2064 family)